MADSESHLGPGHASGLAPRSPSLIPSGRLSTDNSGSQDDLLPRNAADDNLARELGDSVPDAPARVEEVAAENLTHATNRRLGKSKDFNKAQLVLMLLNDYCQSHGLLLIRAQFPLYQKSSRTITPLWTISTIGRQSCNGEPSPSLCYCTQRQLQQLVCSCGSPSKIRLTTSDSLVRMYI
jgi:hypothetical protein